jgi:hypothetical protein
MAALAKRYPPPSYALLEQVGNGTGFTGNRWADALAMGLWPSRGLHLNGFEIKVSRADWLRELKRPDKAEEIACYCDFWWVVAPVNVVTLDELPIAWGLLELNGRRGLVAKKAAPERKGVTPLDTPMVAAILRRATEHMVPRSSVAGLISDAREEGIAIGKERAERESGDERVRRDLAELAKAVERFETASGVSIGSEWQAGNVGRRFKVAAAMEELQSGYRLRDAEHGLQAALDGVKALRRSLSDPEGA